MEPVDAPCFQSDLCDALTRVHAGHPVWTRLELVWGAPDTFRMVRQLPGMVGFGRPVSRQKRLSFGYAKSRCNSSHPPRCYIVSHSFRPTDEAAFRP